jgi:uncharacterized protein YecT (DUF1311 family)
VEPDRRRGVQEPVRRFNWTIIALIAGLAFLVLLVVYFATNRNSDQDKLTNSPVATASAPTQEKLCASKATYDLIKRELFRRAAQLRGSDQAAYDKLSAYAVLRMENPVMESEDSATGTVKCSGSLSLDLPPGVAVVGGRRSLMSDVDYTVQPAADGSGTVVLLRNADAIIAPLATLAKVAAQPAVAPKEEVASNEAAQLGPKPAAPASPITSQPSLPIPAVPAPSTAARPSFSCAGARTKTEIEICSDAGLATLDRNTAAQYGRAIASASPEQSDLLRQTRDRFLRYRDRCPNRKCIGDAYVGRMREIRDITEGRWQPPR